MNRHQSAPSALVDRVEGIVPRGKVAGFDLFDVVFDRLSDLRIEVRVLLREAVWLRSEPEYVGDDEHLPVDVAAGPDTDSRDVDRLRDLAGDALADGFEDD